MPDRFFSFSFKSVNIQRLHIPNTEQFLPWKGSLGNKYNLIQKGQKSNQQG